MKKTDFVSVFIIFSLCAVGLFHEFVACVAGAVLCIYLCVYAYKNKKVRVCLNLCSLSVASVVGFYGLSTLWAVDSGSAFIGFFKFLPLLLFLLVIMQQEKSAEDYFKMIPYVAAIMTVASAVLMQIPGLKKWFAVSGRLAGFFQYSNTFALFLLIALIIIATKEKIQKTDFLLIPVILFGIFYSGSRTVFVLLVVAVLGIIIFSKNKVYKITLAGVAALATVIVVVYSAVTDNFSTIGRFLTLSLTESTFVGRLLYFADALPVILRHPFGMGYMGYYFFQQSVQTGVYTVKFIHNDFLQLMLDVGWVPVIILVAAIAKSFFRKGASLQKRLLLLVISAHTCFDFNFQYLSVFMLFIMLLDYKDGTEKEFCINKAVNISVTAVCTVLCLYMGLSQALSYFKNYSLSDKLYPYNTLNHIQLLVSDSETGLNEKIADKIIENNGYVAIAYDVKAKLAYSEGDFAKMMDYKEKAIEVSPFTYETYEDYCYMLVNGIYLYSEAGDEYSAKVCMNKLISVAERVEALDDKLSKFGTMIDDQPNTVLPDEIQKYVKGLTDEK